MGSMSALLFYFFFRLIIIPDHLETNYNSVELHLCEAITVLLGRTQSY